MSEQNKPDRKFGDLACTLGLLAPSAWEAIYREACETAGDVERMLLERGLLSPGLAAKVRKLLEEGSTDRHQQHPSAAVPAGPASAEASAGRPASPKGEQPTVASHPAGVLDDNAATKVSAAKKVGNFRIVRMLGKGSMGVVYEAIQEPLGRRVALKTLPTTMGADAEFVERFHREARALALLDHSGIVTVFESGTEGDTHYYAMEYIAGRPMNSLMKEQELVPDEAAMILLEAAEAMAYAHLQGVVHRDLKPSNILLVDNPERDELVKGAARWAGRSKISDFGLVLMKDAATRGEASRLTATGTFMGTPAYMPPEQAAGKAHLADERSDVYSLGATLYDALAGQPPFSGGDFMEVAQKVLHEDPPLPRSIQPQIPRDLETIALKCLEKDPARRYPTSGDLAADLQRYLHREPILARPVPAWRRLAKRVAGVAIGVFSTLVVLALLCGTSIGRKVEMMSQDLRFLLRPQSSIGEAPEIIHLDIDDTSIAHLGRWPWPWDFHADLVDVLQEMGSGEVIFDVVFSERPRWVIPAEEIEEIEFELREAEKGRKFTAQSLLERHRKLLDRYPRPEEAFASAIRRHGSIFLAAQHVDSKKEKEPGGVSASLEEELRWERLIRARLEEGLSASQTERPASLTGRELQGPIAELAEGARGIGLVNAHPDEDAVVRGSQVAFWFDGHPLWPLAMRAAWARRGEQKAELAFVSDREIRVTGEKRSLRIPLDDQGNMLVHWSRPDVAEAASAEARSPLHFSHSSYAEVYQLVELRRALCLGVEDLLRTGYFIGLSGAFEEALEACHELDNARKQMREDRPESQRDFHRRLEAWREALGRAADGASGKLEKDIGNASSLEDKRSLQQLQALVAEVKDLLREERRREQDLAVKIRGKVIFIGETLSSGTDLHSTPLTRGGAKLSGVQIHSNAFFTLLRENFLRPIAPLLQWALTVLLGWGLALGVFRLSPGFRTALLVVTLLLYIGSTHALFVWAGWILWLAAPLIAGTAGFLGAFLYRQFEEEHRRRHLEEIFERMARSAGKITSQARLATR